jgi:hypothetical protein
VPALEFGAELTVLFAVGHRGFRHTVGTTAAKQLLLRSVGRARAAKRIVQRVPRCMVMVVQR